MIDTVASVCFSKALHASFLIDKHHRANMLHVIYCVTVVGLCATVASALKMCVTIDVSQIKCERTQLAMFALKLCLLSIFAKPKFLLPWIIKLAQKLGNHNLISLSCSHTFFYEFNPNSGEKEKMQKNAKNAKKANT